jgi:hypothetical protein
MHFLLLIFTDGTPPAAELAAHSVPLSAGRFAAVGLGGVFQTASRNARMCAFWEEEE